MQIFNKFINNPYISKEMEQNITSTYGEYECKRVDMILRYQRNRYREYVKDMDFDIER